MKLEIQYSHISIYAIEEYTARLISCRLVSRFNMIRGSVTGNMADECMMKTAESVRMQPWYKITLKIK
jgi:hypothetical protein